MVAQLATTVKTDDKKEYCSGCGIRTKKRNYSGDVLSVGMVRKSENPKRKEQTVNLARVMVLVADDEVICKACVRDAITGAIPHLID